MSGSKPRIERSVTAKQDVIERLRSLQRCGEDGSNIHADADAVLCDFLDSAGYEEIAQEFRRLHEMYPTVIPRYSKPSWQSGT